MVYCIEQLYIIMNIAFIELKNFRKLHCCKIEFSNQETVFVGSNNSGKTSAMDALILFLKEPKNFKTQDITLSNWKELNAIGEKWAQGIFLDKDEENIEKLLPQLDLWIKVENNEIHYVKHLIPTLGWIGGLLGIRLRLSVNDIKKLGSEFNETYTNAKRVSGKSKLELWPTSLWEFLDKNIHSYLSIKSYILDPAKISKPKEVSPQELPAGSVALDTSNALAGIVRVDIINAQRGFTDTNDENTNKRNLTSQLKDYYEVHLDPSKEPSASDVKALTAIEEAKQSLDERLKESFKKPLGELEALNYPGFGNPNISLSAKISAINGLDHDSAVRFELEKIGKDLPLSLPESYNGLGYQNLISMAFRLIRFRDAWMQTGKKLEDKDFEPLHFVLIEEPEAHLHAQAQQVFIKRAYEILRFNENLGDKKNFSTQLAISTHSSHIAYEVDFKSLRYFKRNPGTSKSVPTSSVVNLSETFGEDERTSKFVERYLKITHCDLFFADAVVIVEGAAERMLVPYFIENHFKEISSKYISILEIGGSHAHTLKPLIDDLSIITLIITDLDSSLGGKAVQVELKKKLETSNNTLKSWHPKISDVDSLLSLESTKKTSKNDLVRVAYQTEIKVPKEVYGSKDSIIYPYTFEDALAFTNLELFKKSPLELNTKFSKKIHSELNANKSLSDVATELFTYLRNTTDVKASFALDILFVEDPSKIHTPQYIVEGFEWLQLKLKPLKK